MKLSKICEILGLKFSGEDLEVSALNSLKNASASELSYCDSQKNAKFVADSKAGVLLVAKGMSVPSSAVALECDNPHLAFAILSKYFAKPLLGEKIAPKIANSANIMPNVYVGLNSQIGENCMIMHGAFIGENVKIGDDCIIHPNAVIYNDTIIGNRCEIQANAVIGSDGFGYAHTKDGRHVKIYHNGNVVLEDDVEIGACTTIDRAVFETTLIKKCTKIDNLVQIGHNCVLGEGCLIVSQTGLAGSTTLGRNVVMGGQSGTKGHIDIGDFAQVAARGGVSRDLEGGKAYAGYHPIMEIKEHLKFNAKILKFFKDK